MKISEIKNKETKELEKMTYDLKKKLSDIRFKFSGSKLKNVKEISNMKKDIARILTIIEEKNK